MPYTVEEWKTRPGFENEKYNGQIVRVEWAYDYGDPDITYFKYYGKDIDETVDLLEMSGEENITMNSVWKLMIMRHHNISDENHWRNGVKDYELHNDYYPDYEKGGCGDEHNFNPEW